MASTEPRPALSWRRAAGSLAGLVLLLAGAGARAAEGFDGRAWWATVEVLAADRFLGRDTGSPGERAAQQYVIGELRRAGVAPAGVHGFEQPIDFRSRELNEARTTVALVTAAGAEMPLTLGAQLVLSTRVALAPRVEAPLAFVGYGLVIPELGYDDLAGLDLRGKVAVYLMGSPSAARAELAAHHSALGARWQALKRAGAIGMIAIQNPAAVETPWARVALNRTRPSMALADPAFDETAGAAFSASWNPAQAELLFKGSGHTFAELAALGEQRAAVPHFDLAPRLRATTEVATHAVHAANLIAKVEGSDPVLRTEYVVLSAHLDHLGIGEPIDGDRIYNGAMDNASGSALLLELARAFARAPARPRRSVLFVWLTGEEKGLLGSRYFANRPTVPAASLVADLNVDMFLPIIALKRVTVFGLAESDLGERARRIAEGMGIAVQADPEPLRNVFIRSDQYNFVRVGVPALMIDVGAEPGSPEAQVLKRWRAAHYHAPSDDTSQPVDLACAGRFEDLIYALTRAVADDPARPAWKPGSVFARFAPGAPAAR